MSIIKLIFLVASYIQTTKTKPKKTVPRTNELSPEQTSIYKTNRRSMSLNVSQCLPPNPTQLTQAPLQETLHPSNPSRALALTPTPPPPAPTPCPPNNNKFKIYIYIYIYYIYIYNYNYNVGVGASLLALSVATLVWEAED